MTFAILDTGFLYALADRNDKNHESVKNFSKDVQDSLILPITVLPEICYLLTSRLGHQTMRRFIAQISVDQLELTTLLPNDLQRCHQLLEIYADSLLDFTDVSIVSIAERLHIKRLFTFDRRDFSIIRPRHCDHFDLLP